MTEAYRSYVIRIRRRTDLHAAVRLELEDLVGGGRAACSGPDAEQLADQLVALLRPPAAASAVDPAPGSDPIDPGQDRLPTTRSELPPT
jgi:hypothetical protein